MRQIHRWEVAFCLCALSLTASGKTQAQGVSASWGASVQAAAPVQAYTRGPVHEAFIGPVQTDASIGVTAAVAPPAPLREVPPAYAPRLRDVTWVPGYWGWDQSQNGYLWISGGWRVAPAGHRYVPGYWAQGAQGYRRYPGFWMSATARQVAYLPPLPVNANISMDPVGVAPSRNHFWIPGAYEYRNNAYTWRAGYWGRGRDGFVWVPDTYLATPRGTIFVAGYWDVPLTARGQLFAPVGLAANVAAQANVTVTPSVALKLDQLPMHLFVGPGAAYYFGNYYGPELVTAGWVPWYDYGLRKAAHYGYDPLFTYYQWYYGLRGVDYAARLAGWNAYYVTNVALRPPAIFAARATAAAGAAVATTTAVALAVPYNTLVVATPAAFAFLNATQRQAVATNANALQLLGDQRVRVESVAVAGVNTATALPLPVIAPVQIDGISAGVGTPSVTTPGVAVPGVGVPDVGGPLPGVNLGGDGGLLGGGGGLLGGE